ncbi:MAG TPA: hypothetical protein VK636_07785 [Gemmatimonadaceae bacterium]|nr:hypothetical protein [Gemmatimonadaceae bacterium]
MELTRIGRLAAVAIIATAGMMIVSPKTALADPPEYSCIDDPGGYCSGMPYCCWWTDMSKDTHPDFCGCEL